MGKYILTISNTEGPGVEFESEFLPRVGEEYTYNAKLYHVVRICHETFRRGLEMDGKLETEIKVFLKIG